MGEEELLLALWLLRTPDEWAVAKAADQFGLDATKVAAIWFVMMDETERRLRDDAS